MRRRVLLARSMVGNPDLLLLDEPTNHLDPDTIEWLEKYLAKPGLSIVFVSHDRRFMANVADEVLELDRGKLFHGRMGYHRYLEQRQARMEEEVRAQARFAKKLSEEEVWIRTGIQARRTRNEGRVRRLQAMREQQRKYRRTQGSARADLNTASASGKIVLELEGADFSYDQTPVLRDVNLRVMRGDRIGIIGANGSGKTTLLNLMLGKIAPECGVVRMGTKVELAEFDQHRAVLDETRTLADNVCDGREFIPTGKGERHIISYLQDFLFTPEQARAPIRRLSGGERARLLLARLFSRPFNLLVMDEPTNDLDIETLELLEEILTDYDGTLLLVSHDREFLDNVTTSIIHVDGNSNVVEYSGGYAEFMRTRQDRSPAPATTASKSASTRQGKRAPKLSYKLKLELETLPRTIEKLEADIEALHRHMSDPTFYTGSADHIASTNENLVRLERELAECYVRWEQLEQSGK
jgi:ABC transport system ATP-binding/permease protein